jgi:1,2-beta-oligoglucan phosphorylase
MKKKILKNEAGLPLHTIGVSDGIKFQFSPDGTLYHAEIDDVMINLFNGNILEGSLANLYLRIFTPKKIRITPLFGPQSSSKIAINGRRMTAFGKFGDIEYQAAFLCAEDNLWFQSVQLRNTANATIKCDLVCFQDIGIAHPGAIHNNEAYVSQYIDQAVFNDPEYGYILCARQNQGNKVPHLISGCLNGCDGFLTDGFQFYGLSSKEDGVPASLRNTELANEIKQYEFSAHTLKSKAVNLEPDAHAEITFFFHYNADHQKISSQADMEIAVKAEDVFAVIPPTAPMMELCREQNIFTENSLFASEKLRQADLDQYFGSERYNEEPGKSFFTANGSHVVLKAKELSTERPHGHILRSGNTIYPDSEVGSCAVWMNGVFNSHQSFGNIGFQMCTSVARGALNLQRSGGVRIFANDQLLAMPSAFEIGLDKCRWLYQNNDKTIMVTTKSLPASGDFVLEIEVSNGAPTQFTIITSVVFGGKEYEQELPVEYDAGSGVYIVRPAGNSLAAENCPNGEFRIIPQNPELLTDAAFDSGVFVDGESRDYPFLTTKTKATENFSIVFAAHSSADLFPEDYRLEQADNDSADYWKTLRNNAVIRTTQNAQSERLREVLPWFIHNAMIHFSTPYGLEQFNGAAWGTRDVCQGPVEMLLALGQESTVRETLLEIYRHQYHNGDWPQWFMFDGYRRIQQTESHGDIIVWPIKAVCDYIENTNDCSILDAQTAYTGEDFNFTPETESLRQHIARQLDKIEACFVPDTCLISYGDGDWNDSLQPADKSMKKLMVSTWTVQLLYQQLSRLTVVFKRNGETNQADKLKNLCAGIKADFNQYLVKDGITAGFAYFKDPKKPDLLLHPDDNHTNIKYRLLPVNRGIISEIFTPEQADTHAKMAKDHLIFPDGANLMYPPPVYRGGESRYFQRAETAAFFGREIGNHYVHAHLRYAEAMAKLGQGEDFLDAMLKITPVKLQDSVSIANSNQSNCYFSSFDAAFNNRYEVAEKYDLLKAGKVNVNVGWRIYSSGPGIYVSLLISRFFGLRPYYDKLVIDPVIPAGFGTVEYQTQMLDNKINFRFIPGNAERMIKVNGKQVEPDAIEANPFRVGGMVFNQACLKELLIAGKVNKIEVIF